MKKLSAIIILLFLASIPFTTQAQCRKHKKQAQVNSQSSTPVSHTIDSVMAKSAAISYDQALGLLANFFDDEVDSNGNLVYTPKMVQIEMERSVIVAKPDSTSEIKMVKTKVNVPLITLAPIQMVGLDEVNIDNNGNPTITMKELPLPKGVNTLIEAFSNSIQPMEVSK